MEKNKDIQNMTAAKQSQAEQNMKSNDGQDPPPKPLKILRFQD